MGLLSSVLLVHGWGGCPGVWDPLLPIGAEEIRTAGFLSVTDADGFLPAVLAAMRGRSCVLIGWSMGALLAVEAAAAEPASVRGLVLIGGTPRFVSDDRARGWPGRVLRRMRGQVAGDSAGTLAAFRREMFSESEGAMRDAFDHAYPIPESVGFTPEGLAAGLEYLEAADVSATLCGLSCPVLWIHGREDRICPVGALDAVPSGHLKVVLESAGHAPFWTRPKAVRPLVEEFLSHVGS